MPKKHHHHEAPAETAPQSPPAPQADGAEAPSVVPAPDPLPGTEAPSALPTPDPLPSAERRAPGAAVEDLNDKYLRLAAEYDNFRRRNAKERLELSARAQGDLLRMLIDPLDDLARVIAQGPGAQDARTVLDAVEVVDKKMMKALLAAGLEILNPVDQPFDPSLHEAVSTVPAAAPEDDHLVAQVFQPGYRFKGQLLRAARVVVKQWTA